MGKLTALEVKNLRLPGRYGDGGGLYLRVAPGGSKQWVQRVVVDGTRRDLGLGGYPAVSLSEARKLAAENKAEAKTQGKVKRTRRVAVQSSTAPTFLEAARQYHAQASATWKNPKTAANWWQRAEKRVFPAIGGIPVDLITRTEVLGILSPIWTTKPETARKLREIIKHVMAWAQAYGYTEAANPAGEIINAALRPQPKVACHFAALPAADVADAIRAVDESPAFRSTKLAFRFLVLTATRTTETLGAEWGEINLDCQTWTIPAARMKNGKEHRVALSTGAVAVLREAASNRKDDNPLVFPNDVTGKPLSNMVLSKLVKSLGIPAVPHGFRSSFRTWAQEETEADYAVMEMALAHDVGNAVVQSYARSDLLERRRALMQEWNDYLGVAP